MKIHLSTFSYVKGALSKINSYEALLSLFELWQQHWWNKAQEPKAKVDLVEWIRAATMKDLKLLIYSSCYYY